MKKICSCLLAVAILLLTVAATVLPAAAEDESGSYIPEDVIYEENGFGYSILEDGTATILSFPDGNKNIVLPDTLGGHTVTEIAGWPYTHFISSDTISVSLPSSIRALSNDIFYYADQLTEIILRPGNTSFAVDENGVLFNRDKTELIYYPAGKADTQYSVPEGTRKIADGAFTECLHLKEISLPASLETFGVLCFSYCHRLESISVAKDNPFYSSTDGVLFNKTKTILYAYPCRNPRTAYYIPDTVTELADGAFSFCALWKGFVEDDLERLNCTLTALYVPAGVKAFSENFMPFRYNVCDFLSGHEFPIETLTVYLENGSPLQDYCTEHGISYARWDGKRPMTPDTTSPAETNPSTSSADTANTHTDNAAVDIPKTAGDVNAVLAGATAMLAFSAGVALCKKKFR